MSALPCSSSLAWLAKGSTPFGLVTWVSTFFSTPCSRSAHSTRSPSCSNSPSSWATSSGSPWNGAVVSKMSFFMGFAPRVGMHHRVVGGACSSRVVEYDCAPASTTSGVSRAQCSHFVFALHRVRDTWRKILNVELRPRAQPLNLQLRQEQDEGGRAHFHDRGEVELDQRLALIGGKLESVREGGRVGHVLRAQLGVVGEAVQRRREFDQLGLDFRIMRGAMRLVVSAGPGQRGVIVMP